jgi:hypothetical protein
MTRIAALIVSLLLIVGSGWWLKDVTVPVPKYRKGGFGDYLFLAQTLFAVHGSVLFGIAVFWLRASRTGRSIRPNDVLMAGVMGASAACLVFVVGGGLYGVAKYGDFYRVIGGNLWGMLVIFWEILGALVAAGIALLFYALRGPAGPSGARPGTGQPSSPPRLPS